MNIFHCFHAVSWLQRLICFWKRFELRPFEILASYKGDVWQAQIEPDGAIMAINVLLVFVPCVRLTPLYNARIPKVKKIDCQRGPYFREFCLKDLFHSIHIMNSPRVKVKCLVFESSIKLKHSSKWLTKVGCLLCQYWSCFCAPFVHNFFFLASTTPQYSEM